MQAASSANCGATLQTPLALIRPTLEDYNSPRIMRPTMGTVVKSVLLGFPLSVVLDIVLGIIFPDHAIRLVVVFIVPFLLVGGLLVAFGTVTKNQWGINTRPVNCPACGCTVPHVRQPKSIRQELWGGWTCEKCGCEMDKWVVLLRWRASCCNIPWVLKNSMSEKCSEKFRARKPMSNDLPLGRHFLSPKFRLF